MWNLQLNLPDSPSSSHDSRSLTSVRDPLLQFFPSPAGLSPFSVHNKEEPSGHSSMTPSILLPPWPSKSLAVKIPNLKSVESNTSFHTFPNSHSLASVGYSAIFLSFSLKTSLSVLLPSLLFFSG